MDELCYFFSIWLTNLYPGLDKQGIVGPIIHFVDSHALHLSFEVSQFCSKNGTILIAFFPNKTHLLQPIDVVVFHTIKFTWKEKTMQHWLNGGQVTKANFCGLLAGCYRSHIGLKYEIVWVTTMESFSSYCQWGHEEKGDRVTEIHCSQEKKKKNCVVPDLFHCWSLW